MLDFTGEGHGGGGGGGGDDPRHEGLEVLSVQIIEMIDEISALTNSCPSCLLATTAGAILSCLTDTSDVPEHLVKKGGKKNFIMGVILKHSADIDDILKD